jgi:ferrochelatase
MKIGVLITNLGTPDAPTKSALKRYLREFLSDKRIINPKNPFKKIAWKVLLHAIILQTRPKKSAKNYLKIWGEFGLGSPLLDISLKQLAALKSACNDNKKLEFALGMRYGKPSINKALGELKAKECKKLIVLPLYPQFSNTTTASTLDAVEFALKNLAIQPEMIFIQSYHQNLAYIQALKNSVIAHQKQHGVCEKLIISFHGVPQRYIDEGDVYYEHCLKTTQLLVHSLGLNKEEFVLTFQSIFGREKWIEPYTEATLKNLGAQGVKNVQVICPGFAADCLETLEEIQHENKAYFLAAGGENFSYIKALNDDKLHIKMLKNLIIDNI